MKVDLLYETYHTYYYIWICPYIRFQSCNMPYYKWPRDAQGKQFNNTLQAFHFELYNNYFNRVNGNVFSQKILRGIKMNCVISHSINNLKVMIVNANAFFLKSRFWNKIRDAPLALSHFFPNCQKKLHRVTNQTELKAWQRHISPKFQAKWLYHYKCMGLACQIITT